MSPMCPQCVLENGISDQAWPQLNAPKDGLWQVEAGVWSIGRTVRFASGMMVFRPAVNLAPQTGMMLA